jgi:hypothetical protein
MGTIFSLGTGIAIIFSAGSGNNAIKPGREFAFYFPWELGKRIDFPWELGIVIYCHDSQ